MLDGEDWFELTDRRRLEWPRVLDVVDAEQRRLAAVVDDIGAGRAASAMTEAERFNLVLGITCHAIYHAGQIQLIKRLRD